MSQETVYTSTGQLVSSTPLTPEQQAQFDAVIELQTLRDAVKSVITDIKTERDKLDARFIVNGSQVSNATVAANPGPFVKDNYTAIRRTMNAVIDLAKLVKDV